MNKETGLYTKYAVKKISNPDKQLDCIVLEFDDPIAQVGIKAWARAMEQAGYHQVAKDVERKLSENRTREE